MSRGIRVAIVIVLVFILFGFLGWLINSASVANSSLAIDARRNYYFHFLPTIGLNPKSLPFEITPISEAVDKSSYVYTLIGKYSGMYPGNQTLALESKAGNRYSFKYSYYPTDDFVYKEKINNNFENVHFADKPIEPNEIIMVEWSDTRTLDEITTNLEQNSEYKLVNPFTEIPDYSSVIKVK
jgi:hypothetical protein